MTTVFSLSKAQNYRGVVRAVEQIVPAPRDELLEAAVHAAHSASRFVKSGFMRATFTPSGAATLEFVGRRKAKRLPAVDTFLLFVDVDAAVSYLTLVTGIGVVTNQMSNDNPF